MGEWLLEQFTTFGCYVQEKKELEKVESRSITKELPFIASFQISLFREEILRKEMERAGKVFMESHLLMKHLS